MGWANPSSVHQAGRRAKALLERARDRVAAALGARPADVVFTSGGTEACNLGVFGSLGRERAGVRIITSSIEHPAVAESVARLAGEGVDVVRLGVPEGVPFAPEQLAAAVDARTRLVVVQWVNHETGTCLPVAEYAAVLKPLGVPLFVDACQAFGKLPLDVTALGASAVAVASTKVGGPAGAAALWVDRGSILAPILAGGAQERGRRAGTPDVCALSGFGAAAEAVGERLAAMPDVGVLRARLEDACRALGGIVNAANGPRVPTVTNLSFSGWRGEHLVAALDLEGVCAAAGAACSSGLGAPSPVLLAMYPGQPERASSALRFSLGPSTTEAEVDAASEALRRVLGRV